MNSQEMRLHISRELDTWGIPRAPPSMEELLHVEAWMDAELSMSGPTRRAEALSGILCVMYAWAHFTGRAKPDRQETHIDGDVYIYTHDGWREEVVQVA